MSLRSLTRLLLKCNFYSSFLSIISSFGWLHFIEELSTTLCIKPTALYVVAERKNFKLLFSAGIVLAVGVLNLYISSNENDWCHSARVTSPGNIKGCLSLPLPHLLAAGHTSPPPSLSHPGRFQLQTDGHFNTRERIQHWASGSFRRSFLINYFFLLN